jgi:hypothetical protein
MTLNGVIGLLSLVTLGLITTNVVNLGRLLDYDYTPLPADFPVEAQTLKTLKIANGALLVIPVAMFLMSAYAVGSVVAAPEKAVMKEVTSGGGQSRVQKRPILFGTLFFVLSGAIIGVLVTTGVVFGNLSAAALPSGFPLTVEKLTTLKKVSLYTTIVPGLIMIFALALIFKAIKAKNAD